MCTFKCIQDGKDLDIHLGRRLTIQAQLTICCIIAELPLLYLPSIEMEINIALLLTANLFITSVLCLCVLSVYHAGGQTRDVDPMSGYCWPTVYDAELTLAQYWVTVSAR